MVTAYDAVILADPNLASYWILGEAAPPAADSGPGAPNPLVSVGTSTFGLSGPQSCETCPTFSTAVNEQALRRAVPVLPSGATPRTLEAWVRCVVGSGDQVVLSYGNIVGGRTRIDIILNMAGVQLLGYESGGPDFFSASAPALFDGAFHHVVLTYDGATSMKMYLDAALLFNDPLGGVLATGLVDCRVGAREEDGANQLFGRVSHAAIYSYEMPLATIAVHQAAMGGPCVAGGGGLGSLGGEFPGQPGGAVW